MSPQVGGYELGGLVGEGAMGAVYRGRDPRFDREVAIKVLHESFRSDPHVVERFKAEAVIQAKLNHPHIVTVLDFVADERTLAMVMEFVEGQTLSQVIEACRGPMPVPRALALMDQVLAAMAFAHARGLVHRDLKPSNILVQTLEGQEYAKVMDFGIAKILGSEKLRTATGAKMGTLAYMSPEHVRSPKHVDARSDIYSLGVVLYELLTGQVPFDADTEFELMRQIVATPPPLEGLPEPMRAIAARALAKSADARFQSCQEMRTALEPATPAKPSQAPPAQPATVPAATPRAAGQPPARPASARAAAPPLASQPGPGRTWVWLAAGVGVLILALLGGVLVSRRDREPKSVPSPAPPPATVPAFAASPPSRPSTAAAVSLSEAVSADLAFDVRYPSDVFEVKPSRDGRGLYLGSRAGYLGPNADDPNATPQSMFGVTLRLASGFASALDDPMDVWKTAFPTADAGALAAGTEIQPATLTGRPGFVYEYGSEEFGDRDYVLPLPDGRALCVDYHFLRDGQLLGEALGPWTTARQLGLLDGIVGSLRLRGVPAAPPAARPSFRVVRVAIDDFLYVRDAPDPKAAQAGAIPPDARGVEWLGPQVVVGRYPWYRVRWRGVEGWVNSAFLERE